MPAPGRNRFDGCLSREAGKQSDYLPRISCGYGEPSLILQRLRFRSIKENNHDS